MNGAQYTQLLWSIFTVSTCRGPMYKDPTHTSQPTLGHIYHQICSGMRTVRFAAKKYDMEPGFGMHGLRKLGASGGSYVRGHL
jgi:hypothetical protein